MATPTPITPGTRRAEFVKGLRALADAIEAHPQEIPLPYTGTGSPLSFMFLDGKDDRGKMAAAARALPCDWRKSASGSGVYFDLDGELHGVKLRLTAFRSAVCERVVNGTEDIEVEEVVTPAVTRTVRRQAEKVEWVCAPVLAPAAEARKAVA